MECWHCGTKLIWGADHDLDPKENDGYIMATNLSCPNCGSIVDVYQAEKTLNEKTK